MQKYTRVNYICRACMLYFRYGSAFREMHKKTKGNGEKKKNHDVDALKKPNRGKKATFFLSRSLSAAIHDTACNSTK